MERENDAATVCDCEGHIVEAMSSWQLEVFRACRHLPSCPNAPAHLRHIERIPYGRSLTDDTAVTVRADVEGAVTFLMPMQSEPRIPSECRNHIATATRLLRSALRKL